MPPAATVAATTAILRKPVEDLYQAAKGEIKLKLKIFQTEKKIRALQKSITAVQNVKTLWAYSKPIPLTKFYYPSRIVIDGETREIERISEIAGASNIVIEGTAGQGKSIFLRYLCLRELSLGLRIPIFIELRRLGQAADLIPFITRAISDYGIDCDPELFDYLASSGKIVLLADGFDEVDPSAVAQIVTQLETLVQRYSELQVVVTSRPDSGINRSAFFHVYQLASLTPEDHEAFLTKILGSPQKTTLIVKAIARSPAAIKSLLHTPLLMTLLVLVYNSTNEIPSSFGAFYQELFHTLATRHDKTKPGFARKRASGLADSDLCRLFEAFCYFARQHHRLVFDIKGLDEILSKSLRATALITASEPFIDDITKTACLMLEEGFEYHFVHKSVAEFHAAAFIARAPEEVARKFYSGVQSHAWLRWRQELTFLAEIDRLRYLKLYFIPALLHDLRELGFNAARRSSATDWAAVKAVLNKIELQLTPRGMPSNLAGLAFSIGPSYSELGQKAFLNLVSLYKVPLKNNSHSQTKILLGDFLEFKRLQARATDRLREVSIELHDHLSAALSEIEQETRMLDLIDPDELGSNARHGRHGKRLYQTGTRQSADPRR